MQIMRGCRERAPDDTDNAVRENCTDGIAVVFTDGLVTRDEISGWAFTAQKLGWTVHVAEKDRAR